MWLIIKKWAWKTEPPTTPSDRLIHIVDATGSTVSYSQEVREFLDKAYKRYCADCDRFFDKSHALTMHRRFKHKA